LTNLALSLGVYQDVSTLAAMIDSMASMDFFTASQGACSEAVKEYLTASGVTLPALE